MSRLPAFLAAGLALALGSAAAGAHRPLDPAEARYQTLLAAAKDSGQAVDWQALRYACADRPGFTGVQEGDELIHLQAMRNDYKATDYAGAIVEAKHVIDEDFVDPEAHLVAAMAYQRNGDGLSAGRETTMAKGLLESIQTGNGATPATAFTVITAKEEQVWVTTHGRRITATARRQDGGHSYDRVETADAHGAAATFYFQVDRVIAAEAHVLTLPNR